MLFLPPYNCIQLYKIKPPPVSSHLPNPTGLGNTRTRAQVESLHASVSAVLDRRKAEFAGGKRRVKARTVVYE